MLIEYKGFFQICNVCGARSKLAHNESSLERDGWILEINNNMCPECALALREIIKSYRQNLGRTVKDDE